MSSTENLIFFLLIAIVLVSLPIGVLFYRHIRLNHPQTWDRLGRPTFWNSSPANGVRVAKFLWTAEYRKLQDRRLDNYILVGRILNILCLLILLVFFYLMFHETPTG